MACKNPLIDPRAPLSAFELVASAIVYDLALRAIPINARARRVSHSSWEVHVSTYEGGDQLPTPLDEGGNRVISIPGDSSIGLWVNGSAASDLPPALSSVSRPR